MSAVGRKNVCSGTGPGGRSTAAGLRPPRLAGRTRATVRWGQNGRASGSWSPAATSPASTCRCRVSACGDGVASANRRGRFPRGIPTGSGSTLDQRRGRIDLREGGLGDRLDLAPRRATEEDQRHVQGLRAHRPQRRVIEALLPARQPAPQIVGDVECDEEPRPRRAIAFRSRRGHARNRKGASGPVRPRPSG